MLEFHTTREGRTCLIAQMDDEHLENTIKFKLRKLIALRESSTTVIEDKPFNRALYGVTQMDPERAGEMARVMTQGLYPYLAECALPGRQYILENVGALLADALGREGRLSSEVVPQLPEPDYDAEDYARERDEWGESFT